MSSRLPRIVLPPLLLAAVPPPPTRATRPEGTVTGLVVNEATGETLGSATVVLAGTEAAAVTDHEGLCLPRTYVDIGKRIKFGVRGRF